LFEAIVYVTDRGQSTVQLGRKPYFVVKYQCHVDTVHEFE